MTDISKSKNNKLSSTDLLRIIDDLKEADIEVEDISNILQNLILVPKL